MASRFELVLERDGRCHFQLRDADGAVLLVGLPASGKIMAQNEVQHARRLLQEPAQLVEHTAKDGSWFLVLKEPDGTVLARTAHVATAEELTQLRQRLQEAAPKAPLIDLTKRSLAAS